MSTYIGTSKWAQKQMERAPFDEWDRVDSMGQWVSLHCLYYRCTACGTLELNSFGDEMCVRLSGKCVDCFGDALASCASPGSCGSPFTGEPLYAVDVRCIM
jgi:hypothetical protein